MGERSFLVQQGIFFHIASVGIVVVVSLSGKLRLEVDKRKTTDSEGGSKT